MKLGAVILAAGAASRMQQAKMLLPFAKQTILSHILGEALAIEPDKLCLVTGCYHKEIRESLAEQAVPLVYNEFWQEGMAGSIRLGMATLLQGDPDLDAVILLVSDQPFISRQLLATMSAIGKATDKGIVAATYSGITGTPVLFKSNYFAQLQNLRGDSGAKSILKQYMEDVEVVDFPLGAADIDTPEDYENYCLTT